MEKLKQLPLHWQLVILVGTALLLGYGFRFFVTDNTYAEAQTIKDQSDALARKNEQARIATQHIEEFRQLFAAKNAEYEELKVLLPEQREITNVLNGLLDTAHESRLTMLRFTPRDDSPQGFITGKPVEVEISSNFGSLREFYGKMAKLPRIVSISDFKINQRPKQSSDKTIDSQFLLTAYYASPEAPAAATAAPGMPGAPTAAAPAGAPPVVSVK